MKSAAAVILMVFGLSGALFAGRAEAKPGLSGPEVAGMSGSAPRKESASKDDDKKEPDKEKAKRRRPGAQADRCTHSK